MKQRDVTPSHSTRNAPAGWAFFDRFASRYAFKDVYPSSAWARKAELAFALKLAGLDRGPLGSVLEVGAGVAAPARVLQGRYARYLALDGSWPLLALARRFHGGFPLFFPVAADAQTLPLRPSSFDVALAIGALHHMERPDRALRCLFHSLKPGGVLILREPISANPAIQLLRRIRMLVDRDYSRDQVFFRIVQLEAITRAAGFLVEKTAGFGLFSTPFAQVTIRPLCLTLPLSRLAVRIDRWVASKLPWLSCRVSFNVVVVARRPS